MSAVLDSLLVALASDYTSFGFLAATNSLWTWIAVIVTAALSFWRIRAIASSASSSRVSEEPLPPSLSPSSREDEDVSAGPSFPQPASCGAVEEEIASGASTSSLSPPSPTWFECDSGSATKGKFTTFYEEDRREDEPAATAPGAEVTTVDESELGGREGWWGWERAVRLWDGERGWRKFQDLRAINGNVVRLWDEC